MSNQRGFKAYFSFRWLITPGIIRVIHVIGLIIINLALFAGFVGGVIFAVAGEGELELEGGYIALGILIWIILGIVNFIVVNLVWRIICEQGILFFSIHEINASMENELKDMNKGLVKLIELNEPGEEEEEDQEEEEEEEDDD